MPAAKNKSRKQQSKVATKKKSKPAKSKKALGGPSLPQDLAVAAICGAILGLCAPGFNQWYLAWFGLVPFLLLTVSSTGIKQAFLRGLTFGSGYSLVYLNWYLHLYPMDWLGFAPWQSAAISAAAWFVVAFHQALIISLAAMAIRFIPMSGGFWPRNEEGIWRAPALLVIPLLWVAMENKIGNAHDWLGVPWPMIEYSQYKMLPIIQIASWIGGIGLGALILMVNCVLAGLIATFLANLNFKSLAYPTKTSALAHTLAVGLVVIGCLAFGYARLSGLQSADRANHIQSVPINVVQGDINIEMQKNGQERYTLEDLTRRYTSLMAKAPGGLCVWTESALPTYLRDEHDTMEQLAELCKSGGRDMIVGSLDRDSGGRPFNSAFGITAGGALVPTVYHKRYLVPFGEYMPSWVKYMPAWLQKLTSTPAGTGFNAGKFPVVIDFGGKRIAPLICFETISPELVATSVRDGGNLLVNLSDLAWFHDSMCGDQMIAFSVMRAVENHRDFVFAANTGPSAIIDSDGQITTRSHQERELIMNGHVKFHSDRTPFVEWFN